MGARFYRSIKLGHGLRLNFSKTGVGLSAGIPGLRVGIHSSGRRTATIGIPGTGLSYRRIWTRSRGRSASSSWVRPLACLRGLVLARRFERAFVRGILCLAETGDTARALIHFEHSVRNCGGTAASPSFFAGFCASSDPELALRATEHLEQVLSNRTGLPDRLLRRYLTDPWIPVRLTGAVSADVPVSTIAAPLLLAELHQTAGRTQQAIEVLESIVPGTKDGKLTLPVVVSLGELYCLTERYEDAVSVTNGLRGDDDLSSQALVFRGRALSSLGLDGPAVMALREALRSSKRPMGLYVAARYERALAYEKMGRPAQARQDLEAVYATDKDYADVRERLAEDRFSVVNAWPSAEAGHTFFPKDGSQIAPMLREVRIHAGLTQRQLANRAGVSVATISNIEGGAMPRRETLARLLRACEVAEPDDPASSVIEPEPQQ
jgi:DNA-binding XRE family transcriptional regulator/tetratricopeptide (TPR) repeat protein